MTPISAGKGIDLFTFKLQFIGYFSRYILLQFLILFQYLKSNVKFKTDAQALSSDQDKWIGETTRKIYRLLEETPPLGPEFARSVKRILHREEHWNRWKNEGCPSLARKTGATDEPEGEKKGLGDGGSSRKKKRKLGDVVSVYIADVSRRDIFVIVLLNRFRRRWQRRGSILETKVSRNCGI